METVPQSREEEMEIDSSTQTFSKDDDRVKPEDLSELSLNETEEEKEDMVAEVSLNQTEEEKEGTGSSPRNQNVPAAAWTEAQCSSKEEEILENQSAIGSATEEATLTIDASPYNTTEQEFESLWASLDVSAYSTLVNKLQAGNRDTKRMLAYLNLRSTQAQHCQRACVDMNQHVPRSEELTFRRVWEVTKYMNEANALAHETFAADLMSQAIGTTEGLERHLRKSLEKIDSRHRAALHDYSERCKATAVLANKTQKLTSAFYNSTADLKYVNIIAERLGGQRFEPLPSDPETQSVGDGVSDSDAVVEELTDEEDETNDDSQSGSQSNRDKLSAVRHSVLGGISKLKSKMLGSELSSLKWREKVAKLTEDLKKSETELEESQADLLRAEVALEACIKQLMKELQALELNRMEIVQLVTKTAALLEHDLLDSLAQNNRRYRSVERSLEPRDDIRAFFRHIAPNNQNTGRWEQLSGNLQPISPELMRTASDLVTTPTSPSLKMLAHGKGTALSNFSNPPKPPKPPKYDIYTNPNYAGGKSSKSGGKTDKVKKFLKKKSSKFRSGSPTAYIKSELEKESA